MHDFRQTWHLVGGPMDGLNLKLPIEVEVPAELVFREDEVAPWWDAVYRRRGMTMVEFPFSGWRFDYTGDSEGRRNELWYRQQFVWRDEEIIRLHNRLERQDGWLKKLRGTIKAMKARNAKKRKSPSRRARPEKRPPRRREP